MSWLAVVRVGDLHVGLEAALVSDSVAMPVVTPVPLTVAEIAGVAVVRGRVHTVMDLGVLAGLPPTRSRCLGMLVVLRHDDANDPTALLVDEMRGYVDLPELDERDPDRSAGPPEHEVPVAEGLRSLVRTMVPLPRRLADQGTLLVISGAPSRAPARGVLAR